MDEGIKVDPFEIREVTDETADETLPLIATSINGTIDHMGVKETSFVTPDLSRRHRLLNQVV